MNKNYLLKKGVKDKAKNEDVITTMLAIDIGNKIKNKLGKVSKLKGNYKKYYNNYITFIDRDIKYINKTKEFSKKEKIKLVEDLEDEKTYVECVFRYFQENKIRLYKKKNSEE